MTTRKCIWISAQVMFIGGLFYVAVWPFISSGNDMRAFCASLAKNAPLAQVRGAAERNGYRMTTSGRDGTVLIHESRSLGRFICEVQFKEGGMTSARYQSND